MYVQSAARGRSIERQLYEGSGSAYAIILASIQRKGQIIVPGGSIVLQADHTPVLTEGDNVILYTQMHLSNANRIQI